MDTAPKQQIVEKLKEANNVLISVSANPSVDQLAASLGFALYLTKMGKHATAVFSGEIPYAMEFLEPEKTIVQNTDSLRDFIISLDKSKADKLRYKVEDEFVKVFITPYKTSITQNDLEFSQGDFNVDVVVALGVRQREQLDQAITAHGRILHDATVISVNIGDVGDLGSINWAEADVSSLCEMLVSITEDLKPGIMDSQIATAFLTGVVAETERFSNSKTSPKVMTMSARLMNAGANQQLISTKLEEKPPEPEPEPTPEVAPEDVSQEKTLIDEELGVSVDQVKEENAEQKVENPHEESKKPEDGSFHIDHEAANAGDSEKSEQDSSLDGPDHSLLTDDPEVSDIHIDELGNMRTHDELGKGEHKEILGQTAKKVIQPLAHESHEGVSLNAMTSDQITAAAQHVDPMNQPVVVAQPEPSQPELVLPPVVAPAPDPIPASVVHTDPQDNNHPAQPEPPQTLMDLEKSVHSPHLDGVSADPSTARNAVNNAINSVGFDTNRPEPVQSLNASPIDLDLSHADAKVDPNAPPAVPPPMMPPLQ